MKKENLPLLSIHHAITTSSKDISPLAASYTSSALLFPATDSLPASTFAVG
jgi:hypothetical protein